MLITSKEAGMVYPHKTDKTGVVVEKNPDADNQAGKPEAVDAVTDRANDLEITERPAALPNSTFAERAKMVDEAQAENKAVSRTRATTRRARKATR